MNVPAILDLLNEHLGKMEEDDFQKDFFELKLAEANAYLLELRNHSHNLQGCANRLKALCDGEVSPCLPHELMLARTAVEIAVKEHALFFHCCDIASFLRSQDIKDECLNF